MTIPQNSSIFNAIGKHFKIWTAVLYCVLTLPVKFQNNTPISGRVGRMLATEKVDSGSIRGRVFYKYSLLDWKTFHYKDYKNWYSLLSYLTFSN